MMTKYCDMNDQVFKADRPDELVRYLHEASYAQASSDAIFMQQMAGRVKSWADQDIRFSSCEEFVEDLIRVGYLKIVPDEDDTSKMEKDSDYDDKE